MGTAAANDEGGCNEDTVPSTASVESDDSPLDFPVGNGGSHMILDVANDGPSL